MVDKKQSRVMPENQMVAHSDDLIDRVYGILKQHSASKTSVEKYNIYKILHVESNEVLICRVLADLLNPGGQHDQGAAYLKGFLREVLKMDVTEEELGRAHVYKEYLIENDRRIDIVITYGRYFIPIEVKIYAGDQKSQCYDYYTYAEKKSKEPFIVYLTRYGGPPSSYSVYGGENMMDAVPEGKIRCLSFSKDIMLWLRNMKEKSTENMKPMIEQLMGAIKYFTNSEGEEVRMQIVDEIGRNKKSLMAAIEIANAINDAKGRQIYLLLEEFEKQMRPILDKYGLVEEDRSHWYYYKKKANAEFYAHAASTYPGLNYVLRNADMGEGLSLWFRIEVEYRLFGGFCVFNYNLESEAGMGNQQDDITPEIWEKAGHYLELPKGQSTNSWILDWRYIPSGSCNASDDGNRVPDFKAMNEAAIELADKDKRESFVKNAISMIETVFLSMMK